MIIGIIIGIIYIIVALILIFAVIPYYVAVDKLSGDLLTDAISAAICWPFALPVCLFAGISMRIFDESVAFFQRRR
jgi:hypothetical protein